MGDEENATDSNGTSRNVRTIKVMISSTRADLRQYRERAVEVFNELNKIFLNKQSVLIERVDMETETQSGEGETPLEISKKWVEASDWVILIVGRHYGTISRDEGANGLSVTEWEYVHALEKKKKVFLFLSGPPKSSDPYDGQGDDMNLAMWTEQQNKAQAAGLKAFRAKLEKTKVATFFRSASDFEKKLRFTLMQRLMDLPPDFSDPALRALFATLLDRSIKPCFEGVKQLYSSKETHDAIHRLRQKALVPLRDKVDRNRKGVESAGMQGTVTLAGETMLEITRKTDQLEEGRESQDLKRTVGRLGEELRQLRVLDGDDRPLPINTISEQLDECFDALEKAFEAANAAMSTKKDLFEALHDSMTLELEKADRGRLSKSARTQIEQEIEKTKINRDRLLRTLEDHDTWQKVHREVVDSNNSGKLAKQRRCVEREAPRLAESMASIREQAKKDGEEDITALVGVFDALTHAQAQRLALPDDALEGAQQQAWDDFCSVFDDCFFKVDQRTLDIVGRSKARVEAMEASFRDEGIDKSGDA